MPALRVDIAPPHDLQIEPYDDHLPSSCYKSLDARFDRLFVSTAALDALYSGCRWAEGPAYLPAVRSLVSGPISQTTVCYASTSVAGPFQCFASPPGTLMAIRLTDLGV